MSEDSPTHVVSKIVALILVAGWLAVTLALTFDAVAAEAPPYFIYFTALIFLIVGKLWDIEVSRILPTGGDSTDTDTDSDTSSND